MPLIEQHTAITTKHGKCPSFSVELKHPSTTSLVDAVYPLVEEVESRVNPGSRSLRQIEDNAHVIEGLRKDAP
jgi:hypothetical protein